jgi:hypothetical protein
MITAGLIQRYPSRFKAALPMCGVLSGGVATWNTALDAEFAFQQLIDLSVSVANITDPSANVASALTAAVQAQKTAAGRARLAWRPRWPTRPAGSRRSRRSQRPAIIRPRRSISTSGPPRSPSRSPSACVRLTRPNGTG